MSKVSIFIYLEAGLLHAVVIVVGEVVAVLSVLDRGRDLESGSASGLLHLLLNIIMVLKSAKSITL